MKISALDGCVMRQEGINSLSRRDIERIQLQKLNAVLHREKMRGGFYGGLPDSLSNLGELHSLPFTTPRQLGENSGSMLLISQAQVQRVITDATSGTTGVAKRVFYTADDCRRTVEFFAAGISEMVCPGGRTLVCMPFSGQFGLGDLISRAVESLGAVPIKAGAGLALGEYSDIIEAEKPDAFIGMPSQLLSILRAGAAGSLRRALPSGDACPDGVLKLIAGYGLELFPHYGSREMALGGAVTCPAHEGMHLRENHVVAEIIGGDDAPLPAGEEGELVVTTIGMEAMPLIRYRTGDVARILPEKCPCGSELLRLDGVKRRDNPMEALDDAVFSVTNVVDYRAEASERALHIEALTADGGDGGIRDAAQTVFPGCEISVSARSLARGDALFYAGKRTLGKL